jgi:hypothetical protein
MKLFKKLGSSFKKDMKMLGSSFKKPPHKALKERFSKKKAAPATGGVAASPEVVEKAS